MRTVGVESPEDMSDQTTGPVSHEDMMVNMVLNILGDMVLDMMVNMVLDIMGHMVVDMMRVMMVDMRWDLMGTWSWVW